MPDKRVLTDRTLKALKPAMPGKRDLVWDLSVPGLAVRITEKGRKSFYAIGRAAGSRKLVNHLVGAYPQTSLAEARVAAREVIMTLAAGKRPREEAAEREREAARHRADTFAVVAENFLKRHAQNLRSSSGYASVVRRDLMPALGDRQI